MAESSITAADIESIVFGDECELCARLEPCDCSNQGVACACTCGRCTFGLPDDDND